MLPRYKNVRSLVNVHTLDLHGCNGIKDVSALQSVHTLNLSCCCYTVTDISALGDVHTLKLGGCKGITDISCLRILVMLNSCLQFWVGVWRNVFYTRKGESTLSNSNPGSE